MSSFSYCSNGKRETRTILRSDTAKAFELAREFSDSLLSASPILRGEVLQNIGIMRMITEEYDRSIPVFREALKLFRELGDSSRTGYVYRNLGLAQSNMGRPDSALDNYYLSLTYLDSLRSPYYYALTSRGLARTLFSLYTFEYSAQYYRRAIRLFVLDGRLGEAAEALHELAYLLVRQDDEYYTTLSEERTAPCRAIRRFYTGGSDRKR